MVESITAYARLNCTALNAQAKVQLASDLRLIGYFLSCALCAAVADADRAAPLVSPL
jgi:hypothetical protein